MAKQSAGLLLYRFCHGTLEVLLAHPGGPFFRNKDAGAWTIPKGEPAPDEALLSAAIREFEEEIGFAPEGPFVELPPVRQKGGKRVHCWACPGDCDVSQIQSNCFSLEWPPGSGHQQLFPEVDQARFFDLPTARLKINLAQVALLDALEVALAPPQDAPQAEG